MSDDISRMYDDLRRGRLVGRGKSAPRTPRTGHKEYARMPRIALPTAGAHGATLDESMSKRSSHNPAKTIEGPLSLEDIGALLGTLAMRPDGTRPYPSGGALYPVETYYIGKAAGYPESIFHYHPKAHALEHLWPMPPPASIARLLSSDPEEHRTARAALLFTAVWQRSSWKYGDFAFMLTLFEAGHMAQNVLLTAAARGLPARPIAGFSDALIKETLHLNEREEQPVYAIRL